jgi:hypothetical protein
VLHGVDSPEVDMKIYLVASCGGGDKEKCQTDAKAL